MPRFIEKLPSGLEDGEAIIKRRTFLMSNNSWVASDISLIDTTYKHFVDIWVVFLNLDKTRLPATRSRFWSFLKPGFQHVECWKYVPPGAWIRFDTGIELVIPEVYADPPWKIQKHLNPTVKHVRRFVGMGDWREIFHIGPVTCVELTKAFLGVSSFFVRTPFQLYNFLRKEDDQKCSQDATGRSGSSGFAGTTDK